WQQEGIPIPARARVSRLPAEPDLVCLARGGRVAGDRDLTSGTPANDGFVRVEGCDLCRAARITPWYHEDEVCWVAECDICETPMVVWRFHGTTPPEDHLRHMQTKLREV